MIYSSTQFTVDSNGAYLVSLTDAKGVPILFERAELDGKRRGGSHVCLPYFGPDAVGELPQHGFGRDVTWQVEVSEDRRTATCSYVHTEAGLFYGLEATLVYELASDGRSLMTKLRVRNGGEAPFSLSPGFHPYFVVQPDALMLNGEAVDYVAYEPFRELPGQGVMMLETGMHTVTVESKTMPYMIVWSDARGEYLCVEPTAAGNVFDASRSDATPLLPGESRQYSYCISWA
jgi:galactose mutarotase-like enzyme